MKKGPILKEIPLQRYLSCSDCEYFQTEYAITGQTPRFNSDCHHPKWSDEFDRKRRISYFEVLSMIDQTPDWCPLK